MYQRLNGNKAKSAKKGRKGQKRGGWEKAKRPGAKRQRATGGKTITGQLFTPDSPLAIGGGGGKSTCTRRIYVYELSGELLVSHLRVSYLLNSATVEAVLTMG